MQFHNLFTAAGAVLMSAAAVTACGDGSAAGDGLIKVKSNHSVGDTADRLEATLKEKGMRLFARVPHSDGAASVGLELKPTLLVLFGNPKAGTPLMQQQRTVAIDLPQKMLIWEDAAGAVWLAYNAPAYLKARHSLPDSPVIEKITGALANFAQAATE